MRAEQQTPPDHSALDIDALREIYDRLDTQTQLLETRIRPVAGAAPTEQIRPVTPAEPIRDTDSDTLPNLTAVRAPDVYSANDHGEADYDEPSAQADQMQKRNRLSKMFRRSSVGAALLGTVIVLAGPHMLDKNTGGDSVVPTKQLPVITSLKPNKSAPSEVPIISAAPPKTAAPKTPAPAKTAPAPKATLTPKVETPPVAAVQTFTDVFSDAANGHNVKTYVHLKASAEKQPLVLFVQGRGMSGTSFTRYVNQLAEAGYAVVAADYPDTYGTNTIDKTRSMSHDMQAIILGMSQSEKYKDKIDFTKIGFIGNSDGGATVITAGFDQLARVMNGNGVKLIIALSGAVDGGLIRIGGTGPTMINIDGSQDRFNHGGAEAASYSLPAAKVLNTVVCGMGHWYQLRDQGFVGQNGADYGAIEMDLNVAALNEYVKGVPNAYNDALNKHTKWIVGSGNENKNLC